MAGCLFVFYLRNRPALAVICRLIIHCLEVSCNEDQIMSDLFKEDQIMSDLSVYKGLTKSELLLNKLHT